MSLAEHYQPIEVTHSAQLSIDPQGGVRSERFDDIYFYPDRGADETQHVFIEGNALPERWARLEAPQFCIAELGFGTGLNFLVTVDAWLRQFAGQAEAPTLYYYSVEKFPLTPTALAKVFQQCNFNFVLDDALLAQYPDPVSGEYCLRFEHAGCHIVLLLLFADALDAVTRLECYPHGTGTTKGLEVDAWYMDGFAPSQNQAMWAEQLCQQMALHSKPGSTLATFSVARSVREHLASAGFQLTKKPGFGNKRHMLSGAWKPAPDFTPSACTTQRHNNCFARAKETINLASPSSIAVIGAGIAGACTAHLLAQAGKSVTVIDAAENVAGGASGNRRGILFARTGKQRSALGEWHEAAFHFAHHFYRQLDVDSINTGLTGMLKLGETLPAEIASNPELCSRRQLSREQASNLAGLSLRDGGVFYPEAGHLSPVALCESLLTAPGIHFLGGRQLLSIQRETGPGGQWLLKLKHSDGKVEEQRYTQLVVCAGHQSAQFDLTRWLPIRPIRGQSSQLPANQHSTQLAIAVCDKGYVAPSIDGRHDCGATFNLHETSCEPSPQDDQANRDNVAQCFTQPENWDLAQANASRVGFRATTPDYLPIVGPLADPLDFAQQYAALADNAKQPVATEVSALPGLYVNTGYGSHGLTLAPLASFALAAEILGRPSPISDKLRQAIAPNRFLLRGVIRQQPLGLES